MPSSRLPVGHGRGGGGGGYHSSGVFPPNGRSSALPRSGSSSVFSSLETQRTISKEQPADYRSGLYRPGASTLRSSSLLPAPPGFGLPRANERRIQDDLHLEAEKSNTSLHSSDDDFDEEGEDAGRHADGNPPGERKKRDIQPMQPIASMASFSKQRKLANSNNNAFADPQGKPSEQELFANPTVGGLPIGQPPRLSTILRALFPNWVAPGMITQPLPLGPWSTQSIAPPLPWVLPGQFAPAYDHHAPYYGPNTQG